MIRDPKYWAGEIEKCERVVVEDARSPIAEGYAEAGIPVRSLKPRKVEQKGAVIDLAGEETRALVTKLNVPLSKQALAAKKAKSQKKSARKSI